MHPRPYLGPPSRMYLPSPAGNASNSSVCAVNSATISQQPPSGPQPHTPPSRAHPRRPRPHTPPCPSAPLADAHVPSRASPRLRDPMTPVPSRSRSTLTRVYTPSPFPRYASTHPTRPKPVKSTFTKRVRSHPSPPSLPTSLRLQRRAATMMTQVWSDLAKRWPQAPR